MELVPSTLAPRSHHARTTLVPRPQLRRLVLGILPFVVSVDCRCAGRPYHDRTDDAGAGSERAGMATLKAYQPVKRLSKKVRRGFRGYPVATIAFYGPDAGTRAKWRSVSS